MSNESQDEVGLQDAKKCIQGCKKRQGTTSVVPQWLQN
jgi:hypothetical protein